MCHISDEDKRFWLPTIMGLGFGIIALGITIINPPVIVGYIYLGLGGIAVIWAICWSRVLKSKR